MKKRLIIIMVLALFAFSSFIKADDIPIKKYSSDNRLMNNVVTLGALDNGMVLYGWEWNDTARGIHLKYGASKEDGGYLPAGLMAQDVQVKYPDAVYTETNGYLVIDLPALAETDEYIAKLFVKGICDKCQSFFNEWWNHIETFQN